MKRVFISFAIEDVALRNLLVGQARNDNSPFEFVDMSVKQPWDSEWKSKCRTKIKGCDGMIAIVTKNTNNAAGQKWEIQCSKEEDVPRIGILGNQDYRNTTSGCEGIRILNWTWSNIKNWINSI